MNVYRRTVLATGLVAALLPPAMAAGPATVQVRMTTELGDVVLEVEPARAPVTVANFLKLVDGRHLDGGVVYRIVSPANQGPETAHKIEVVQWGRDPEAPDPFPPIAHETTAATGIRHQDGTISMARLAPGTASSAFFICIGEQPELDFGGRRNADGQGFAAFGRVVQGMDVVRAIYARAEAQQMLQRRIAVTKVVRIR